MTITVTLYTRKDCAPCQQVKADLEAIQSEIPHTLVEIDVDSDAAVCEKYAAEVSSNCKLYLQPEWDKAAIVTPLIIDYIKANPKWELSLQVHKYINVP